LYVSADLLTAAGTAALTKGLRQKLIDTGEYAKICICIEDAQRVHCQKLRAEQKTTWALDHTPISALAEMRLNGFISIDPFIVSHLYTGECCRW